MDRLSSSIRRGIARCDRSASTPRRRPRNRVDLAPYRRPRRRGPVEASRWTGRDERPSGATPGRFLFARKEAPRVPAIAVRDPDRRDALVVLPLASSDTVYSTRRASGEMRGAETCTRSRTSSTVIARRVSAGARHASDSARAMRWRRGSSEHAEPPETRDRTL